MCASCRVARACDDGVLTLLARVAPVRWVRQGVVCSVGDIHLDEGGFGELLPARGEEAAEVVEPDVSKDSCAGSEGVG